MAIFSCAINLDSILKSRDITLPTKVHLVEAMVFPVVMYGCVRACTDGWVRGRGGAHNTGKRVHVWAGVWKEGENERRAEK